MLILHQTMYSVKVVGVLVKTTLKLYNLDVT